MDHGRVGTDLSPCTLTRSGDDGDAKAGAKTGDDVVLERTQ